MSQNKLGKDLLTDLWTSQ